MNTALILQKAGMETQLQTQQVGGERLTLASSGVKDSEHSWRQFQPNMSTRQQTNHCTDCSTMQRTGCVCVVFAHREAVVAPSLSQKEA